MPLFLYSAYLWLKNKAWPWLKAKWHFVAIAAAVIGVYLFGKSRGKTVVVNDDAESDAARANIDSVNAEVEQKVIQVREDTNLAVSQIIKKQQDASKELAHDQAERAEELIQDPESLTSFLKETGKKQRE